MSRTGWQQPPLAGVHVLFVVDSFEIGGAERQALVLAKHLRDNEGAEVGFLGFSGPGRLTALCETIGAQVHVVPRPPLSFRVRAVPKLLRYALCLRAIGPDLLLPYTRNPNVVCGLAWRLSGASSCVWNQRDEGFRLGSRLTRLAIRLTPWFLANSDAAFRTLALRFGVPPKRARVIRNGLVMAPPAAGRAAWRARLGARDQDVVYCMVANLHGYKDHETLLRSWVLLLQRLEKQGMTAVLALAGRFDASHAKLVELCRDLGLAETVRFLGEVDDVAGLLGAVDVLVHSSRSESCPNAVIEAMASGLPVVASDTEGVRGVLPPTGRSFLAPLGDPEGLAEMAERLCGAPALRQAVGNANRRWALDTFSPARMCEETVDFLSHLPGLASKRRVRPKAAVKGTSVAPG